jgi:hypothetical protein
LNEERWGKKCILEGSFRWLMNLSSDQVEKTDKSILI